MLSSSDVNKAMATVDALVGVAPVAVIVNGVDGAPTDPFPCVPSTIQPFAPADGRNTFIVPVSVTVPVALVSILTVAFDHVPLKRRQDDWIWFAADAWVNAVHPCPAAFVIVNVAPVVRAAIVMNAQSPRPSTPGASKAISDDAPNDPLSAGLLGSEFGDRHGAAAPSITHGGSDQPFPAVRVNVVTKNGCPAANDVFDTVMSPPPPVFVTVPCTWAVVPFAGIDAEMCSGTGGIGGGIGPRTQHRLRAAWPRHPIGSAGSRSQTGTAISRRHVGRRCTVPDSQDCQVPVMTST